MAHNHLMSNQQLTMNPGVSVAGTQQPSVMSQRGAASVSAKSAYQMQSVAMSHLSHLQQQQTQLGNSYHNHKQMPSDIFSPVIGSVPTQNGSYQTMSGSSLLGLDNTQLSKLHQTPQHHQYQQPQQQPPIQTPVQQHHYQPPQSIAKPQQQAHQPQQQAHQPQQQAHQPQQQAHQPQQQAHQPQQQHIFKSVQQQVQQVPQKPIYQQQHLQILQQRSPQHQHKYQKQHELQPKQILQHSPPTQKTASQIQPDSCVVQEQPKSGAVMNGHHAAGEHQKNCLKAEDKPGQESPQETTNNATEKPCLANTKEKTPMCLINELARFNKILHQYTLVDEQGPAHKKTFFVKLKLAEEEYSAAGDSIKKAQHTAASIALEKSKYPQPPPKPARFSGSSSTGSGDEHMTPTVELNALAMKRGESAVYKSIEPPTTAILP